MSELTKWGLEALARVETQLENLAQEADFNDANASLGERTVNALEEIDVSRSLTGAEHSSAHATLTDLFAVTTRIAHGCASAAWVSGVYACGNYVRSLAPLLENVGDGKRTALVLGRPTPAVRPSPGGVFVSGRWPYASGVNHASASCVLVLDPRTKSPKLAVIDERDYDIEPTWDMPGMRGTGSNTIVASEIFVPDAHLVDYQAALNGELAGVGDARYSLASLLMIGLLGSLVGSAERSFEFVSEAAENRRPPGAPFETSSVTPPIVQRIGRESLELGQLRLLASEVAATGERAAHQGGLDWAKRAWARASAAKVANGSRDVIDGLITAYGTSAFQPGTVLNRAWRDTHVGSRHAGFAMDIPEYAWGMAAVGQDPRNATVLL